MIGDDHPFLDILTRGHAAQADTGSRVSKLDEACEAGTQWQRWDLSHELARHRRLGEISTGLKVPKDCTLRCYVIPAALLSYRDVITMAEDLEEELGFAAVWDMLTGRPDRAWVHSSAEHRPNTPAELVDLVELEIAAASSIRRSPFGELAPASRLSMPLAENALVSQWAMRRSSQLRHQADRVTESLESAVARSGRDNPKERQDRIDAEVVRLRTSLARLVDLRAITAHFINDMELGTEIHPGPIFQRDHRLRLLMRAFAPSPSETIADTEAARSHYPPAYLNDLWELWGAVWIAKELRRMGFFGPCSVEAIDRVARCSWRLTRGDVMIELDFEAVPVLIDHSNIPPVHERTVSAMEWAASHQELDAERPFLGLELKCSPDYLIRVTTSQQRALLVGDACLASPNHHGKKPDRLDAKPYTVERYKRTIGWACTDEIVTCHPFGGFVLFPAPAMSWIEFENLPGAADCMLLCPSPQGDLEASRRLEILLRSVVPEIAASEG
ncbi:hypothetical protein JMG10_25620 [Nostoc ellipsosporum NOK]|nr:hypothetical protein [Nostoc ellipsosporum NOK]